MDGKINFDAASNDIIDHRITQVNHTIHQRSIPAIDFHEMTAEFIMPCGFIAASKPATMMHPTGDESVELRTIRKALQVSFSECQNLSSCHCRRLEPTHAAPFHLDGR